jgi:hypothetical protein
MNGSARVAGRARCGGLRQFAICILLLAISALVLQVPAHASPAGHAIHQEQTAATASHCARHHMPDEHGADRFAGCVSDDGSPNLADRCQTCLTAAVLVEPPTLGPAANGEAFTLMHPDPRDRSPEGILRPPRLIAA